MEYYSQHGQDRWLDQEVFKEKTQGFSIEIGSFNGEAFSNTCFFERFRQWDGICIEPHPKYFAQMAEKRKCRQLNCAVGEIECLAEFWELEGYTSMLSGITSEYDPAHQQRIERELAEHGGTKRVIQVPVRRLGNILAEAGVTEVDYLSVDTEGSELSILKSIDWNQVKIHYLSVENNYQTSEISDYLIPLGYQLINTLGTDEIYALR